jgi:nitroimidazol reductase NimA-like FMN-containing flavoprotein (pyridoxamine 5'-phosphate oxidase superfamily)
MTTEMAKAAHVYRSRPTETEIGDVLAQRLVATVGTLNPDESVHLAYVLFEHHDGHIYFETSSVTRKARNAERTRSASVVVRGQASGGRNLMVSIEGVARVIRGIEAHTINHRLRAKYIRPEALPDVDRAWASLDDVAVEVTPRRQRSWTANLLHEETQKELSVPFGEIWLPDE